MVACQWPQEVLRVPRYADPAALKAAYRRVSMHVHPDKNTAGEAALGGSPCRGTGALVGGLFKPEATGAVRERGRCRPWHCWLLCRREGLVPRSLPLSLPPPPAACCASAAGASDAQSIVHDAYNLLTLGKESAAVPAFLRQNHPTRQQGHVGGTAAGAPAAASASAPGTGFEPSAAAPQSAAAGSAGEPGAAGAGFPAGAGSSGGGLGHASSSERMDQLAPEPSLLPRRSTSEEAEVAAPPRSQHHVGAGPHEHWNPHGERLPCTQPCFPLASISSCCAVGPAVALQCRCTAPLRPNSNRIISLDWRRPPVFQRGALPAAAPARRAAGAVAQPGGERGQRGKRSRGHVL